MILVSAFTDKGYFNLIEHLRSEELRKVLYSLENSPDVASVVMNTLVEALKDQKKVNCAAIM